MKLFDESGLNAGATGSWHALKRDERAYRPLVVTISGTADVDLEVRNAPGDGSFVLKNFTSSGAVMIGAFPQLRVVVNSATGADVRVSIGGVLIEVA